ncbi:hypothetical protein [Bacillus wiedmannii]|uniref:hypothetical protein n=1 Tax=Bacillus wiedmannii TaxID=1890302 RepID=UPI000BF1BA47|nr:hypothetical protein [Bacillus wiedmannii]PEM30171.1 hypothetical protein CN598_12655 [Bacillus wiedmannii]
MSELTFLLSDGTLVQTKVEDVSMRQLAFSLARKDYVAFEDLILKTSKVVSVKLTKEDATS